jgi:hypothetical protein
VNLARITAIAGMTGGLLIAGCATPGMRASAPAANDRPAFMKIHAPYTVNGAPVMGTYGGGGSIAELREMKAAGMNLNIGGHNLADTSTVEGKFCRDNGIGVMFHLTQHLYGKPILADTIDAAQTTIPLASAKAVDNEHRLIILDNERIRYREMTKAAFLGCVRGADGTRAASHRKGMIVFWPEPLETELASLIGSPTIWGWYVLDDSPGDAVSALRAMYRILKEKDPRKRPVCAGYGDQMGLRNFDTGVCDLMLIYFYPCQKEYRRLMISQETQWMLTRARAIVPGIPFIGVYQGFWGIGAFPDVPVTPYQIRNQIEDYVRCGAIGDIAFAARSKARNEGFDGWNSRPDLITELESVHGEMRRTGGLVLPPEPDMLVKRRIQPVGQWQHPQEIPGLVKAWYVAGPFADPEKKILDAKFPPETTPFDQNAVFETTNGRVGWALYNDIEVYLLNGVFTPPLTDNAVAGPIDNVVAYMTCEMNSPREYKDALMQIGSDDDAILFINGQQVWRHDGVRGIHRDMDYARVTIPAGRTRILAKDYNRFGMWGFCLRITDKNGKPLPGVMFSPSPSPGTAR